MECNKYPAAYNAPAGVDLNCGWDIDFTASFIYWYVAQEFMDVAYIHPTASAVGLASTSGAVAYQNFKYKPGFKVGFGFDTGMDDWNIAAEYTWVRQKVSQSLGVPAGLSGWQANSWFTQYSGTDSASSLGGSAVAGSSAISFTKGLTSSWKMHMDMLDLVAGRPFYQGTCLTLSPTGGLRALWIRQSLNVQLLGGLPTGFVAAANVSSTTNSHCWSLGPVAGVTSHWMVGSGFRFEGKMGASLLYTRYTTISHQEQDLPGRLRISNSATNYNALRPTMDMGLGLGWGTYFSDNQYFFDLAARYDFNLFWEQNVMREWVTSLNGTPSPVGDLRMHGLTIDVRFDF